MTDKFTEPVIKGKLATKMLPKGWSLVLEGGGMRGFFSSGVFDAFLESDIMFPYIIGVSAGVANSFSYVSGQAGRSKHIIVKHVPKAKYMSIWNLLLNLFLMS